MTLKSIDMRTFFSIILNAKFWFFFKISNKNLGNIENSQKVPVFLSEKHQKKVFFLSSILQHNTIENMLFLPFL